MGMRIAYLDHGTAKTTGNFVSPSKLFINADRTKVVAETDPEAAFLLAMPGDAIQMDEAIRLGLVKEEGLKMKEPVKNKQRQMATEKKAQALRDRQQKERELLRQEQAEERVIVETEKEGEPDAGSTA